MSQVEQASFCITMTPQFLYAETGAAQGKVEQSFLAELLQTLPDARPCLN
jgi:hypothetical protein